MHVDALTVLAVRDELRPLVGGRVEKVLLPADLAIGLEIRANRADHWLFASAHPQHGRVHLVQERLTVPSEQVSPLLLLLRKWVRDARLVAVEQVPLERVLFLDFRKVDEGEVLESRLVVEVMGRYSNIVLVNRDGLVLDAAKRVTAEMNRLRVTLPRQPYVLPPPQTKADPTAVTTGELQQALAGSGALLSQGLVAALRAISPLLAKEIAFRATGDANTPTAAVADWGTVVEVLRSMFADAAAGRWQPIIAEDESGVIAFAPYRLTHLPGRPVPSMSVALEAYFSQQQMITGHEQAKSALRAAMADVRARVGHKRASLKAGLRQAAEAERLRRSGELVLAFVWQVAPGQRVLEVEGERIELDPERSPVENAQAYFREYAKAKSAAQGLPELLERADLDLAFLDQAATQLDLASSREEIGAIAAELADAGLLSTRSGGLTAARPGGHGPKPPRPGQDRRAGRPPGKAARPGARRLPPVQSLASSDGFEILVGRTGRQNDDLTFRVAAPNDLWFHARKIPGAHVVVRTQGRSVPQRTIDEAAGVAAAHSQARAAGRVPVDYTAIRHVRRIKGAPPGLVTYSQEQTVNATPREVSQRPQGSV